MGGDFIEAQPKKTSQGAGKHTKYSASSGNNAKILCQHCKRTATNNIRCLGMCVADSDY